MIWQFDFGVTAQTPSECLGAELGAKLCPSASGKNLTAVLDLWRFCSTDWRTLWFIALASAVFHR